MFNGLKRCTGVLAFTFVVGGCTSLGPSADDCSCATEAARKKAPELSAERLLLSEGYSIMYRDASTIKRSELILYVKTESDQVDAIVTAVAELGGDVKEQLERIDRDYPGVRIDLDPLPEMEKRKRWAVGETKARDFAPGAGSSQREYERTVLIALTNGINHQRHMCKVMAEAETDAGLKKFLLDTEKRYDTLYDRTMKLLETGYFSDPDGKSKN